MHIALFVATQRGHLVLQHIHQMFPTIQTTVFSFKEEPWEPPFLENIHHETLAHKGQFFETKNIASSRLKPFWQNTEIDLILAIGWRYMIPSEICERARLGTYIIHDSLLPTYRGFSPTVWSIINGETATGATLFAAVPEVDAGDIVAQIQVPIGDDDPISTVMERVTQAYLVLVDNNLPSLLNGTAQLTAQDHSNATFTCKRIPQDNLINWQSTTDSIYNLIRAVSKPYTGAYTFVNGKKLVIWGAKRLPGVRRYVGTIPGRIAEVRPNEGSVVLTGDGALLLELVQLDDQIIVCAADLLTKLSDTLGH